MLFPARFRPQEGARRQLRHLLDHSKLSVTPPRRQRWERGSWLRSLKEVEKQTRPLAFTQCHSKVELSDDRARTPISVCAQASKSS